MDHAEPPRTPVGLARAYYEAIDAAAYDRLRGLLAEGFVQHRPDRTLEGADRFVRFMREERPETDTTHAVEEVYTSENGVAVRGRLLRADGSEWFGFVDTFRVEDGRLAALSTYTR
jgi:ketosteroid isomerase-like protein